MVLLVFVHGYNLQQSYLQPWTMPGEPLTITTFTEYWLANGIFRFRIPMLFIISGYLFALKDNQPHKKRMNKRVRTLLYPYLLWSAFGLLFTFVLEIFPYGRQVVQQSNLMRLDEHRDLLHQYHWYETLARWIFFPVPYQFWFIKVLLIYNLGYPAIRWCVTHPVAKKIFFPVAILLWLATFGAVLIEGEGLLFFSLGVWMQKNSFDIDNAKRWWRPRYWFPVFILLSALKTVLAFYPPGQAAAPMLTIMHKLVVASGFICAWYACNPLVRWFMSKPWFIWASAFSFIIYAMHAPLVVFTVKAMQMLPVHWTGYRLLLFVVLPGCLVMLAILTGAALRKWMPAFYSFATGGRGIA